MEHRRTNTDQPHRQQQHAEAARHRQQQQPGQRKTHAHGQRERLRLMVGNHADGRLQHRRRNLEGESDQPDLRESEVVQLLQQRIAGLDQRLNHVVQQMRHAYGDQDAQHQPLSAGAEGRLFYANDRRCIGIACAQRASVFRGRRRHRCTIRCDRGAVFTIQARTSFHIHHAGLSAGLCTNFAGQRSHRHAWQLSGFSKSSLPVFGKNSRKQRSTSRYLPAGQRISPGSPAGTCSIFRDYRATGFHPAPAATISTLPASIHAPHGVP